MSDNIQSFAELSTHIAQIYDDITEKNYREQKDKLIALRSHMMQLALSREERQQINALLDDCFTAVHYLRDLEQRQFETSSDDNYNRLKPMVEKALADARQAEDKRLAWDYCIQVQGEFRGIKLKKELRESLYQQLQQAFDILKSAKEAQSRQFDKDTTANAMQLKATVDAAFERSKTSMEFKKTREALKRVQASFKDFRLKQEDRQSLYSKLQAAFDMLSQRQDAYYLAKKDKIELHVNYQMSDLGLRIEELQREIDKDRQRIDELLEADENPLASIESGKPSFDLQNQAKVLEAAIARKQEMIDELEEQQARVKHRLDKLEE